MFYVHIWSIELLEVLDNLPQNFESRADAVKAGSLVVR